MFVPMLEAFTLIQSKKKMILLIPMQFDTELTQHESSTRGTSPIQHLNDRYPLV